MKPGGMAYEDPNGDGTGRFADESQVEDGEIHEPSASTLADSHSLEPTPRAEVVAARAVADRLHIQGVCCVMLR